MVDNTPIMLGPYRLGKNLGIGAFGKVKCTIFLCVYTCYILFAYHLLCLMLYVVGEHLITGQKVAVKILNKGKIKHMEMAEKVQREINILNMCTHPHIIRL